MRILIDNALKWYVIGQSNGINIKGKHNFKQYY